MSRTAIRSASANAAAKSSSSAFVRLKVCGWKTAQSRRPGKRSRAARDVDRDLARMMGVVVDDGDAARLALHFEAATDPGEQAQRRRPPPRAVEPQRDQDRQGGGRVPRVMSPRHAERQAERRSPSGAVTVQFAVLVHSRQSTSGLRRR